MDPCHTYGCTLETVIPGATNGIVHLRDLTKPGGVFHTIYTELEASLEKEKEALVEEQRLRYMQTGTLSQFSNAIFLKNIQRRSSALCATGEVF